MSHEHTHNHDHCHEHHDHEFIRCGCGHDHSHGHGDEKNELLNIILGALFLTGGKLTELFLPSVGIPALSLPIGSITLPFLPLFVLLYLAGFLVLGLEIVISATKNIFKGEIFDENFLMSIATVGAFLIREYPEAVAVMLFYRVGEFFEEKAVKKSRSQIMEALDMRPETVLLVKENETETIPAKKAQVGDILLVRPGDRIPLDCVVLEGESQIDTAPITGEPVPVNALPGKALYSGCMNLSGALKIKVEKPLSESMVSRILDSVENAAQNKPKIDRFITKFSKVYTPFVVILSLLTAIIPSLITGDWNKWIYTALTFLVISCPCALVLSVPLAFFSGIGAGSRHGILFKSGLSLEALRDIKAVVMDKTGTITKGNFVVQKIIPYNQNCIGKSQDKNTSMNLLKIAASCEASSTHPIAFSIMGKARMEGINELLRGQITEISGHGIRLDLEDNTYLCGNEKLMKEYEVVLPDSLSLQDGGSEVYLAQVDHSTSHFLGHLVISDTIKREAESAISGLKKQGIKTAILTGDTLESANRIASKVGIEEVHARLLPDEKLEHLQAIRNRHGAVLFVGDGINDAVVLSGADVGAAMGSGADAAMEAADVVFLHSDLHALPKSISIAKACGRISLQNVIFALGVKVLVMILGLLGIASMWLAVIADTGVAMLCILNSIRILYHKNY